MGVTTERGQREALPPIGWHTKYDPRPQQCEMMGFLRESESRYNMIEAPTGSGKSPVCVSVARSQGGLIITPQKMLQDQYARDWPDIPIVKGASNYVCDYAFEKTKGKYNDCGMGRHGCKSRQVSSCPYVNACQTVMIESDIGITNYAWFFAMLNHREWQGDHRWLLMDEGHHLEQQLVGAAEVEIKEKECKELGVEFSVPDNILKAEPLIDGYYRAIRARVQILLDRFHRDPSKMSADEFGQLRTLEPKISKFQFMLWDAYDDEDGSRMPNEWIVQETSTAVNSSQGGSQIIVKPLYAKGIFQRLIDPIGARLLVTSATLINAERMAEWFGWGDDFTFQQLDSPFQANRRRVISKGIVALNRNNIDDKFPDIVDAMDKDLDIMRCKGIIHAHSFDIAKRIEQLSRHTDRMLFHRPGKNQEQLIQEHIRSSDHSIIVSPSLTEGVDLVGDHGRFALFPKLPYPNLGDAWVKRRKDVDPDWYNTQVVQTLVQGSGRVVRNDKDTGITIIYDESFYKFYHRSGVGRLFPPWWRKNITWLNA